jgi:signal transduction histidine kinase
MRFELPVSGRVGALLIGGWAVLTASLGATLVFDLGLRSAGRGELAQVLSPEGAVRNAAALGAFVSAAVVGSALIVRRTRHPVGWLFLALALAIGASGITEGYALYGAVARPGSLPAAALAAVITDHIFIVWLLLLTLILHLTPDGQPTSRVGRIAVWASVISAAVSFGLGLLQPYRGDYAALAGISNPWELTALVGPLDAIFVAARSVLLAAALAGPLLLVRRFRAASDNARQQLRWLAVAAIPFTVLAVGASVAALLDLVVLKALLAGGLVAVIPLAVAFAIERDRLYDVDHLLSRGLSYTLLTALLVACYAFVVVLVGSVLGQSGGDSQVAAVIATLATVSVAGPARRWLQDGLDRRFARRRFEAVASIRRYVQEPAPNLTIEQALRDALGDPNLAIAYWIEEPERWVTEEGEPASPGADAVLLRRRGALVAAITFEIAQVEHETATAVLAEAQAEVENARLRAAIARQLVEVRASRARIVAAQAAERQRIERNLHDGAQQRLLALAFQLRAAEVSQRTEASQRAIEVAVEQLQLAVRELRDLANGLHPSAISDGGLAAALDDLAGRTPLPVRLETTPERFAPEVEEAAWFIACEAVTNAVKHAAPESVSIMACRSNGHLCLVVEDDGRGGADPTGHGLRGIADRAEAAGGRLTVGDRPGGGTVVTAELPCGS